MADFPIKENDTRPFITATLSDANGPIDLTGAAVEFIMNVELGGVPKVQGACVVDDALNGVVHYEWAAIDTDTPGEFKAEFEITFPDGGVLTCPTVGHKTVEVIPDLDSEIE